MNYLDQVYNQTYSTTMVKLASLADAGEDVAGADGKYIRDTAWHDYLIPPSDRAGEIEAALAAQGEKTKGFQEWVAVNPSLATALGGLVGAGVGAVGGPVGMGVLGTAGSIGSLIAANKFQDDLVSERVKKPTVATKKQLASTYEAGSPNIAGFASGLTAPIPVLPALLADKAMADRGRRAYAKNVNQEALSFAERNPKKVAYMQKLLGLGIPLAVVAAAVGLTAAAAATAINAANAGTQ